MNLIDECIIYNKSLRDDLRNYVIKDSKIEYNNNTIVDYTVNFTTLQSLFPNSETIDTYQGSWFPIYVRGDAQVSNKVLSQRGSLLNSNTNLTSGRLGIENFISFVPEFESWTVSPACNMVTDWILNRSPVPYYLNEGIMCWAQEIDTSTATVSNIDGFPIGSRSTQAGSSDVLIKYQDRKLYNTQRDITLFNNQSSTSSSANITFNESIGTSFAGDGTSLTSSSQRVVEHRMLGSSSTETASLFDSVAADPENEDQEASSSKKYVLWIPDGDYFGYYEDATEAGNTNRISRSYISPSLWSTYNAIYHMLSLKEVKRLE